MCLVYMLFYRKKSLILVETTYIANILVTLLKLFLLFTCLSFQQPFRFDRNKNSRGIFFYVCEVYQQSLFPTTMSLLKVSVWNLRCTKKKCLVNCFHNQHRNNIFVHLDVISKSSDVLSSKYDHVILLGDFNVEWNETPMVSFCNSYNLTNFTRQETCFENPEKPKCIDITLTNKPTWIQATCAVETELSDFHWVTVSVMKITFRKLPPKLLKYRDYRNFDNSQFMNSIHSTLSRKENEVLEKDPDVFFNICLEVLHKHAPHKKNASWVITNLSCLKNYQKLLLQRSRLRNKFCLTYLKKTNLLTEIK